ncbi:MAG: hypothetical protein N2378_01655 [Chloroflexaceae bacterium]|nr:hypothetical protein [Chloroflexaceae bacterium]
MQLDDDLWHELAASMERAVQAEWEVELLGWLPTAAAHTALTRLARERSRQAALLRLLRRSSTWIRADERGP